MEQVVEVNATRVATLAESILDHLESLQEDYSELEMVCAITTIYESVISALGDRVDSVGQSDD